MTVDDMGSPVEITPDELNLLYVAVTRAKHRLLLSPDLAR